MIRFEHVSLVYENGVCALNNLDLAIGPSEFVFIIGSTGTGKSTLLKLVYRELVPSAGKVLIDGEDLAQIRASRLPLLRRRVGVVFQDFRLLPRKDVWENIAFVLQATGWSGREIKQRIPEVLSLVGMSHRSRSYPNELSGGEQQRVCIARAIVNHPTILLADEPTGNLDPETAAGIMGVLSRINETGATVVVSTHDQITVDDMRRRVVALGSGQVIRDDWSGGYHAAVYG